MSKSVELDHDFNKDMFAALVKQALGDMGSTYFCKKAGISKGTISLYMRAKNTTPPLPATIFRIVDASEGRISICDALNYAGYEPKKYLTDESGAFLTQYPQYIEYTYDSSFKFTDYLKKSHFISRSRDCINESATYITKDCPFYYWEFYFIDNKKLSSLSDVCDEFMQYINSLMWSGFNVSEMKLSVVTSNVSLFKKLISLSFKADIYLSVILIDETTNKFIDEYAINTLTSVLHPLYNRYTLNYIAGISPDE